MKNNITALFLMTFCVFNASAQQKAKELTIGTCEQTTKTPETFSACLDTLIEKKRRTLTTWTNNQLFVLQELQETNGRGDALRLFHRSNKYFETYRENNCRWQYLQLAPDKKANLAYKKCFIRMTNDRINELMELK